MGFLTSTFMKSYAIRMKLQAQRRLMSITLQTGRIQRQMKNLQTQMKNQQRYQSSIAQADYMAKLQGPGGFYAQLEAARQSGDQQAQLEAQQSIFTEQQNFQYQREYLSTLYDSWYEAQLAPLQDIEEQLQVEKQHAENEVAFWSETEKAYSQQAKDDIKSVVPDTA